MLICAMHPNGFDGKDCPDKTVAERINSPVGIGTAEPRHASLMDVLRESARRGCLPPWCNDEAQL